MGQGFYIKCKACDYAAGLSLGIGMMDYHESIIDFNLDMEELQIQPMKKKTLEIVKELIIKKRVHFPLLI